VSLAGYSIKEKLAMSHQAGTPSAKTWAAPFFTIWTGQAFSLLGSQLVQFALIWWLTKTTGSATVLATASLVGLLPQVVLGPFIGALVDRWNRRVIMILADSTIALATLGLALLFWNGEVEYWHVYLLMFVRSLAGGFHWPAMQASTSLMVPGEHLARVQGLNQMLQGGMNILAAPLGAVLLDVLAVQGILMIDIGTATLAILPLFFIHVPQPPRSEAARQAGEKSSVWQDFRLGLRYIISWPGLVIVGLMATLINFLLNPASALTPILVIEHFNGGAMQLAGLESTLGIGVVIGGITLGVWGGFRRRILTSLVGLLVMGAGSLLLGFVPPAAYPLALAAFFILGFSLPIVNGPLLAAVQAVVAPEMQGRVFTLISSVAAAMSPLGLIIAGPVADTFGVQTWYIVGGVVTIAMGVVGYFIPAVMRLEEGRGSIAETGSETPSQAVEPSVRLADGD
jgi:DHA3 family macrolide efflux protein-like MFS transporter